MTEITCKFAPCQCVRLIHDPESLQRMVTQVFIGANGSIRYELSCGDKASVHYEAEIEAVEQIAQVVGFRINIQP